jgi:NADP-dependent 3-hydroxy acid dehydrogenase YdfG
MPGALDGRVAVVTGASSGIGEATAEALAREGATVAVAARRLDRLEELTKRISDEGGRAETFEVDVADVTVVEPGFVATELHGHNELPVVVEGVEKMRSQIGDVLEAEDIADAITYVVTRPARVDVNEILIRPTRQRR